MHNNRGNNNNADAGSSNAFGMGGSDGAGPSSSTFGMGNAGAGSSMFDRGNAGDAGAGSSSTMGNQMPWIGGRKRKVRLRRRQRRDAGE